METISPSDEARARQTLQALESAWNRHDMREYASHLTEDCEWVNIVGMHWQGRATIEQALESFHRTMFRTMTLQTESAGFRSIAPNVAVAVATVRTSAFSTPDGRTMPAALNRLTYVLVEEARGWLVAAAQNTVVDPIAAEHDPALLPTPGNP